MAFRNRILERLVFPAGDLVLRTDFMAQLRAQRQLGQLDDAELRSLQGRKLERLLAFAVSSAPYYRDLGIALGSDPFADLRLFPVLTKRRARANIASLLTRDRSECIRYATSGSSGIQTEVFLDKQEEAICRAILIHWWEWTGFYLGKPILQTGMTPERSGLKALKDLVTNTTYVDAFAGDEKRFAAALRKIQRQRHAHLGGYPSSLYLLARAAKHHRINVRFDAAICWGDKLFPRYSEAIRDSFGCTVFENYALNEGIMVGQKADLPYFYVYTPHVVVEILDGNGHPVPDGEMGHIVVTKLDGFAMPLIRYETGDLGIMLPRARYPLARRFAFPLLERVIGRDTDLVRTPEGNHLVVHTFTGIFEFFPSILQFKVVQRTIEAIEIDYIPDSGFASSTLTEIERVLREKTGSSLAIRWRAVETIAPSKSGKPQLIESHLDGNRMSD